MLHIARPKIGSSSLQAALELAQLRLLELPTGQGLLLKPWTD